MVDSAPMVIDGLVGRQTALNGARGLHYLYVAAGRRDDAELLWERIKAAEMMASTKSYEHLDIRSKVSGLANILESPRESRSQQWEAFAIFNTFGGCINLNRAVFADNDQYNAWVERSRARLVRFPADSTLFEVARRGILPHGGSRSARCAMPMDALREILSQT